MTEAADTRNGSHLVAAALSQEMEKDASVVVFGEDVARLGGVFGATRGLAKGFGGRRVFDTPVSETAFVGMAVGAAQAGLRPVVEIMFVDFVGVCYDQILNQMAKDVYMSGGLIRVPVVLRTAVGCIGSAAQHSQVLSATFAHIPGLKVAFPGSPADLAGMLVAAIRDDDPVIVLEHKWLLKTRVVDLVLNDAPPPNAQIDARPLGHLRRLREGTDVTIVAAGYLVQLALLAAAELEASGISAGVIDLRSLVPLDRAGLISAATSAPCLLVVDDDYEAYGMTGEVMATISEELGRAAPAMGRHAVRVPIPAAAVLEAMVVPSARSIAEAARDLARRWARG
ncbi:MAG TPA: transketolase C-terminal domain-containing protein [Streptosporangiaceae bacterium]|nr:transketolase C-terminal domain-containing protein [Streptosporangiaceae bacterium]